MRSYEQFLAERAIEIDDLNMDFIRKAEVVTSFNITAQDFQTIRYKREIQYLFKKNFFPDFDLADTASTISEGKVNNLIRELKKQSSTNFEKLYRYNLKGVGPGEVMMFFLVDDVTLGGGSSAGVDILSGSGSYEMKGVNMDGEGYFHTFRLGGTVGMASILSKAVDLFKEAGIKYTRDTEINRGSIAAMRKSKFKDRWYKEVEEPFIDKAYDYLGKNPVIFAINGTPKSMRGEIFVRDVKRKDIGLDMITQGTMRPKVKK